MHKELIIIAFEEAKNKTGSTVPIRLARHLSDFIYEDSGQTYGERSLIDKYKLAQENSRNQVEFRQYVVQSISKYLGYNSYDEFVKRNDSKKNKKNDEGPIIILEGEDESGKGNSFKIFIWRNRFIISLSAIVVIGAFIINSLNQPRWMIWQEDHYVEVKFDIEKYNIDQLKLYKEERIENFRKIIPNCSTTFFKKNGKPDLWYGKNAKGELEYFTSLGQHPETGKSLKDLSDYMIAKYICPSHKK